MPSFRRNTLYPSSELKWCIPILQRCLWRWSHVSPKRRFLLTNIHDVKTHKSNATRKRLSLPGMRHRPPSPVSRHFTSIWGSYLSSRLRFCKSVTSEPLCLHKTLIIKPERSSLQSQPTANYYSVRIPDAAAIRPKHITATRCSIRLLSG